MKKRRKKNNNMQDLPEINIIDLDQEPLEKLISEESVQPEHSPGPESDSPMEDLNPAPAEDIPVGDLSPDPVEDILMEDLNPDPAEDILMEDSNPDPAEDILMEDLSPDPVEDILMEDSNPDKDKIIEAGASEQAHGKSMEDLTAASENNLLAEGLSPLPDQEAPNVNPSEPDSSADASNGSDDTDSSYLQQDDSWLSDDWEMGGDAEYGTDAPDEDDEDAEDLQDEKGGSRRFSKINLHIIFAALLVVIVGLIGYRIWNYGVQKNLSDYEGKDEEECYDSILPLIPKDGAPEVVDDGVTTIVAFGNAPFADDRDSKDNLASMIADLSDATVYNCSVEGSYLAAQEPTLKAEEYPMDAFNFYWLTTLFCLRNNEHVYQQVFDVMGDDVPDGAKEAFDTLTTIDFDTVDVITLMYDGSDYLAGHNMYSDENATDIQQFTGNMEAGIELIQQTYPNIRIIVMSPTYAYAVDEDGNYVSSDMYRYNNQDVLSTYVIKQYGSAYTRTVSFIDHLYGTVTEANASQYLTDNIHLNLEGRKLVAQRFVDALNMYSK